MKSESPILLVTGGSRGIGAAICRAASRAGWCVALSYRADAASARAVVDEIGASGGNDAVCLVRIGDRANRHGRDTCLLADPIREWRHPHAAEDWSLVIHHLSRGHIDHVSTSRAKHSRDFNCIICGIPAVHPVMCRDSN